MRVLSPAWIIVAGVWVAHASGVIAQVGSIIVAIDKTVGIAVDLRNWAPAIKADVKTQIAKSRRHERKTP